MGVRGPLRIVPGGGRVSIADAARGSAAARVSPMAPNKPKGVAEDAELSAMWDEVVPELDKAGLLSTADIATIEMALRHLQVARMAQREIVEDGHVAVPYNPDDENSAYKKHPAEAIFRMESDRFLEYAKQLGMTWMARARTAVPEESRGDKNPFESTQTLG